MIKNKLMGRCENVENKILAGVPFTALLIGGIIGLMSDANAISVQAPTITTTISSPTTSTITVTCKVTGAAISDIGRLWGIELKMPNASYMGFAYGKLDIDNTGSETLTGTASGVGCGASVPVHCFVQPAAGHWTTDDSGFQNANTAPCASPTPIPTPTPKPTPTPVPTGKVSVTVSKDAGNIMTVHCSLTNATENATGWRGQVVWERVNNGGPSPVPTPLNLSNSRSANWSFTDNRIICGAAYLARCGVMTDSSEDWKFQAQMNITGCDDPNAVPTANSISSPMIPMPPKGIKKNSGPPIRFRP